MLLPNTPAEIFLQSLILLLPLYRKESEVTQHNLFPNFNSLLRSYPPPHILFYIACFSFLTAEHIVFCSSGLYLPTISLPGLPPLLLLLSLSCIWLFVTQWTAAHQASLSFTISRSLLKLMSIKLVIPSNRLILCHRPVQKHQFFGTQPFFVVQLSYPYMTTGKTIALTTWTFVSKLMSLLFNMLSRSASIRVKLLVLFVGMSLVI